MGDDEAVKELDNIFNAAEAGVKGQSASAMLEGGFDAGPNIEISKQINILQAREKEKEIVRKTRRHSRNVSYGGVRELDWAERTTKLRLFQWAKEALLPTSSTTAALMSAWLSWNRKTRS